MAAEEYGILDNLKARFRFQSHEKIELRYCSFR